MTSSGGGFFNLQIRQKLLILVAVPLAVVLLLVAVYGLLYVQTQAATANVRQSRLVLQAAESLLTSLLDDETGMRGYVFTGIAAFREPYTRASVTLEPRIAEFERLTVHDAPAERRQAIAVAVRARAAFSSIRREIVLAAAGRRAQAIAQIRSGRGKRSMDALRASLARYERFAEASRDEGLARLARLYQSSMIALVIGLLIGLAATATLYLTVSRNITARLGRLGSDALAFASGVEPSAPSVGRDEITQVEASLREMFRLLAIRAELLDRYELLAEHATDIVLFFGNDDRIVEANAAALSAYGYTREEIARRTFSELHASTARGDLESIVAGVRANVPAFFESEHVRRSGLVFPVEVSLNATTEFGPILAIVRDITARRLANAAIAASYERAVEASRLKSEFVATMSHEIRTPMNAIVGMNELLFSTELDEEQREYAETVREASQILLTIIDDVLDFSKIEAGRMQLETLDFELAVVVEAAAALLAPEASEKRLSVMTFVDPKIPRFVRADPMRLRQVLINLIGNAVKFTSAGSVVVDVTLDFMRESSLGLRFSVADSGIGFDGETAARLFEPFLQADGSTTRKYGGTGLGLSICRRLVELMGGELTAGSSPGVGSTFTFTAVLERSPKQFANERQTWTAGFSALVVDDDPVALVVFQRYLEAWKIEQVGVSGARPGLAALRERALLGKPFDAAIVDRNMPEMDGFAMAEAVKADPLVAATHLILVTAYDDGGCGKAAIAAGFASYLTKPIQQAQLLDSLGEAVRRREQQSVPLHPSRPSSPGDVVPGEARSVLVVEDNPVNQRLALQQLKKLGYRATSASNGEEALVSLESETYDLVLMDCQMPVMDGFTATHAIRKSEVKNGLHVPIIAMTANARSEDRVNCLAAGMDDYLAKPVQMEAVRSMLERWIPA